MGRPTVRLYQSRRTPAAPKSKPAPPPAPKTEPAEIKCSELLGTGVKTSASFCFVLAGRDPAQGVLVTIPPHAGTATLTFSLHNRHTYSEEEMRAGRGFAKYTAVVAVLTMAGDLLGRGAVQSEFRSAKDLYDRVSGGAGPGGVKAVAPIGNESVIVTIPAGRCSRSACWARFSSRRRRPAARWPRRDGRWPSSATCRRAKYRVPGRRGRAPAKAV